MVSLQLFLVAGGLVASGANKAYEKETEGVGWKTVTGIQLIFPVCMYYRILLCLLSVPNHGLLPVIIICTIFIPNSPRWLLSKDRGEEAIAALQKLRPEEDRSNGACEEELREIREGLQEVVHKAAWVDLVKGTNLRRTVIVIVCYFFQQVSHSVLTTVMKLIKVGNRPSVCVYVPNEILPTEWLRGECIYISNHQQCSQSRGGALRHGPC